MPGASLNVCVHTSWYTQHLGYSSLQWPVGRGHGTSRCAWCVVCFFLRKLQITLYHGIGIHMLRLLLCVAGIVVSIFFSIVDNTTLAATVLFNKIQKVIPQHERPKLTHIAAHCTSNCTQYNQCTYATHPLSIQNWSMYP